MTVVVELVYRDKKRNRELKVEVRGLPKGERFMEAVDKAVLKAAQADVAWTHWRLWDVK